MVEYEPKGGRILTKVLLLGLAHMHLRRLGYDNMTGTYNLLSGIPDAGLGTVTIFSQENFKI